MDDSFLNFLLAMAAIVVPLALAALLVEVNSRQKSPPVKAREPVAGTGCK